MALRIACFPARRIPVQRATYIVASFDPIILREERASSPGYSPPAHVTWTPATHATFRIDTSAADAPFDLLPSPSPVTVRAFGVSA